MAQELEPTLNKAPQVTFNFDKVQPPSQLYIGRDDTVIIQGITGASGVSIGATLRILRPDGEIIPNSFTVAVAGDRSVHGQGFALTEGYLLSATFQSFGTNLRRGDVFCQIWLLRGDVNTGIIGFQLAESYVDSAQTNWWPGGVVEPSFSGRGKIRHIVGTDPAAGVEISETVPTNTVWRVIGFNYTLVTSGIAGTRISQLFIDDGANAGVRGLPGATQAPTITQLYQYGDYGALPALVGTIALGALPTDIYIPAGGRIRTVTTALDGGDNYGPPTYCVEEWLSL